MVKIGTFVLAVSMFAGASLSAQAGSLGIGVGTGAGVGLTALGVQANTGVNLSAAGHANANPNGKAVSDQEKEGGRAVEWNTVEGAAHVADTATKAQATVRSGAKLATQEATSTQGKVNADIHKHSNQVQKAAASTTIDAHASGSVKAAAQ